MVQRLRARQFEDERARKQHNIDRAHRRDDARQAMVENIAERLVRAVLGSNADSDPEFGQKVQDVMPVVVDIQHPSSKPFRMEQ